MWEFWLLAWLHNRRSFGFVVVGGLIPKKQFACCVKEYEGIVVERSKESPKKTPTLSFLRYET